MQGTFHGTPTRTCTLLDPSLCSKTTRPSAQITQGAPWGPNETIRMVGYHKTTILVVGGSLGWVCQDDTGGGIFEGFSAKGGEYVGKAGVYKCEEVGWSEMAVGGHISSRNRVLYFPKSRPGTTPKSPHRVSCHPSGSRLYTTTKTALTPRRTQKPGKKQLFLVHKLGQAAFDTCRVGHATSSHSPSDTHPRDHPKHHR